MTKTLFFFLMLLSTSGFSQILHQSRSVDWTAAGLKEKVSYDYVRIDMQEMGAIGDGTTPNDQILSNVLSTLTQQGAILNFPSGNFLFNSTIELPSDVVISGEGASSTIFTMDLGGSGHSILVEGSSSITHSGTLMEAANKGSTDLTISNSQLFSVGDWIKIIQEDADLVTSNWAEGLVGQIVQIKSVNNNTLRLESPLRMDYKLTRAPYVLKIDPVQNVGIECLKIIRLDDTAPEKSSSIFFSYAVNSWVSGVESENCTFGHVTASQSSNLSISQSYFHHAFGYGGSGRAYGVTLEATSNECLVENNIFEHLRHSMLVHSGANGNVMAYNYSTDPFWATPPNDNAGDIVLHGNYPYANLFEQNICQNIIIDNSHGPNGPFNTYFRNRAEGYGIIFSADNSPSQNLIGNEITNNSFPYNLINYTIQGNDHFIYGNNDKGTIQPLGTNMLNDASYGYVEKPNFLPIQQWTGIGTPNGIGTHSIPAFDRFASGTAISEACNNDSLKSDEEVLLYPNPTRFDIQIESSHYMRELYVINPLGQTIKDYYDVGFSTQINTSEWNTGVYFIMITFPDDKTITKRAIKID